MWDAAVERVGTGSEVVVRRAGRKQIMIRPPLVLRRSRMSSGTLRGLGVIAWLF